MAAYTKTILTGSTTGKLIKIVPTSTLGTTIHAAHATSLDEIWLYAVNSDTADRLLTLEYGGVTSPDCLIQLTVPTRTGLILVVPGLILTNSLVLTGFAEVANKIMVGGYVNRIT